MQKYKKIVDVTYVDVKLLMISNFRLGGRGEGNFTPFMKPTYMKKLMRNRAK